MSRWRRLSRKRRVFYLAAALLILATTGWASNRLLSDTAAVSVSPNPSPIAPALELKAPLLQPEEVRIQRTSQFGAFGNVLVTVRLSAAQLAEKQAEGTRDFVVIGNPEAPAILRDDGQGGDATAGDGVFSGPAFVDDPELATRETEDLADFNSRTVKDIPQFVGRAAIGVEVPEPFDFKTFDGGGQVSVEQGVAFVEPEGNTTSASSALISSKSLKITSAAPVALGTNPFQDKVLMIRHPSVVTDPTRTYNPCTAGGNRNGVWTFNHLMTEMANPGASGIDPAIFVQKWLENWLDTSLTINDDPVPARTTRMSQLLTSWPRLSDGRLDLTRSPLRLLAIAPRVDLRRTTGGGGPYSLNTSGNFLDAGEARFIFGFVVPPTSPVPPSSFLGAVAIPGSPGCFALPFSVIFEYRVPKCECKDVKSWAQQWTSLFGLTLGSAAYNQRLENITEQFVLANSNPRNPNGSALGQLRTNEIALGNNSPVWELREFQLTQFPFTYLAETTVEDTIRNDPGSDYNNNANGSGLLFDWVHNIVAPALTGPDFEDPIAPVPLLFRGESFLAGDSRVPEAGNPPPITFHWREPNLNVNVTANPGNPIILRENWARHRVSRATCNGCHRRETFTSFVHVDPSINIPGATGALPAPLSEFLTGINGLGDPADAAANGQPVSVRGNGNPKRNFDDLARRELDIKRVAKLTCFRFHPINLAHVRRSLRTSGVLPINLFDSLAVLPPELRLSVAVDDMRRNLITEPH